VWLYVKTTSEGILQSTYANLQGNERFQWQAYVSTAMVPQARLMKTLA
jgi:hypothetical protein